MNQADKAEALRLIGEVAASSAIGPRNHNKLLKIRALIERQTDTDGEMWRFCVEHSCFPEKPGHLQGWEVFLDDKFFAGRTPAEAVDAAMAAMKEKV